MESHRSNLAYAAPPPFSPFSGTTYAISQTSPPNPMDHDIMKMDSDRSQRAASVLSGISMEDMEAAETLQSLQDSKFHAPTQNKAPPTHLQTTTSYHDDQPEPLLTLLTSTHPLAASLINGSLSAYKTTQSYIPGAEWTERNIGLPLAGRIGRVTGVEGGLRWALQGRRDPSQAPPSQLGGSDVEKGFLDPNSPGPRRQSSEILYGESLPAYNAGDRSPPYSENQVILRSREGQPPPGWRQQLIITTSGLGIAMSDDSIRSLKYCLSWLRWANQRLGGAIQSLKDLLQKWEEGAINQLQQQQPMSLAAITQSENDRRQADISARIAALKTDVLQTLKQVVNVVSNYAGGALPENARNLVHTHLVSLPQRFNLASAKSSNHEDSDNGNEAAGSARRVMVLAQEGLDMMTQVSGVVNDTLVSAESWCEKLGRRKRSSTDQQALQQQQQQQMSLDEKMDGDISRERSVTLGRDADGDEKMQM